MLECTSELNIMNSQVQPQVIIIGAGAAGLMCAIEAAKRGRRVLVLDHANKAGKKILMSGGGRCNFTNLHTSPDNFISQNAHFCKSALSRYTQWDFLDLVKRYHIPYHEKTLGQLFCNHKSKAIVELLLSECQQTQAEVQLNTTINKIKRNHDNDFTIETTQGNFHCESVVIATGGLSIPTMGASPFGYRIAEQFGLTVVPTRAGLVPFTLHAEDKQRYTPLSGVAFESSATVGKTCFQESTLITHRGLSGPAILQISSFWVPGEYVTLNLFPNINLFDHLLEQQQQRRDLQLKTLLSESLPKRLVATLFMANLLESPLKSLTEACLQDIAQQCHQWKIKPDGTEGYRTAEVTLGGVSCDEISSKTMEANHTPGLYFIGEVLDVTGWLGGYNFQWAWSSGWAAGQVA